MRQAVASRAVLPLGVLVLVIALVGAGCGGSGDGGSSSSGTETSSSSEPTSVESSGADLTAIAKKVEESERGPTKYEGPTEPVEVEPGVNLAAIVYAGVNPASVTQTKGVTRIAKELGWNVKEYDAKGTPQGAAEAMGQAISGGADAITLTSIDPNFVRTGLQEAKEKGIVVGSVGQDAPASDLLPFDVSPEATAFAETISNYVIDASKGEGVIQQYTDRSIGQVLLTQELFREMIEANCPDCRLEPEEDFVVTDLTGALGKRVADHLRQNPEITDMFFGYDAALNTVIPVIGNAGLGEGVRLSANAPTEQGLKYIKEGVEAAGVTYDYLYLSYMAVYQVARLLAGEELWETPGAEGRDPAEQFSGRPPVRLFTETNPPESVTEPWVATETLDYLPKMRPLLGLEP